jgi:hypothetical protein
VLADSSGWPCLRFEAVKVRAEQLIPLSAKAAAAIAAQQDYVRERWPGGSPWLFPGIAGNDDGAKPYSHSAFTRQLAHWQRVIGLRDEAGQPVTVTGHQFRHTLGARLKGRGVASNATFRLRREAGAVGAADSIPPRPQPIKNEKVQVRQAYEGEVAAGDSMCHRVLMHRKTA